MPSYSFPHVLSKKKNLKFCLETVMIIDFPCKTRNSVSTKYNEN